MGDRLASSYENKASGVKESLPSAPLMSLDSDSETKRITNSSPYPNPTSFQHLRHNNKINKYVYSYTYQKTLQVHRLHALENDQFVCFDADVLIVTSEEGRAARARGVNLPRYGYDVVFVVVATCSGVHNGETKDCEAQQ